MKQVFFFEANWTKPENFWDDCFGGFLLHGMDIASRLCVLHKVGIKEFDEWYSGLQT